MKFLHNSCKIIRFKQTPNIKVIKSEVIQFPWNRGLQSSNEQCIGNIHQ